MSVQSEQSQALATKLWSIANDLRNNMDSSKFKDYILGVIFYRYLSERTESYINSILKDDGLTYQEALENEKLAATVKRWSISALGYVIEPQYLFKTFVEEIRAGEFSIEHFEKGISELTASTIGEDSEVAFDKLFDDMNLQDKDLGKEVSQRTELISKVILKISDIAFGLDEEHVDILGTAYMILIGLFASDAGKKGGEFYSPTCACVLLSRLATVGLDSVDSVCDPCAGSGSLLLQVQAEVPSHNVIHFYAQELNGTTYNLLRMNLIMHGVSHNKFTTYNDDTLRRDNFDREKFQVQVSNPPYSAKHSLGKIYESDPRFSGAGVLAPSSKADLAFVEHMAYHMADNGRVAVLLPHGVLFRGASEETIRKYLIDTLKCLDAIIGLPANMFHGTTIPVCVLVLKKNRNTDDICFIDASRYYTSGVNQNIITEEDIDRIVKAYTERKEIEKFCHIAKKKEIIKNDYNLNISRYVDTFEEEERIDIAANKAKLVEIEVQEKAAVEKANALLAELGL